MRCTRHRGEIHTSNSSQNDFYCLLKLYMQYLLNLALTYVLVYCSYILENYTDATSLFVISQLSIHDSAKCAIICLATSGNGRNIQLLRLFQEFLYHGTPFVGAVLGVPYNYLFQILLLRLRTFLAFCCKRFSGILYKM